MEERKCRYKGEYFTVKRLRLLEYLINKGFKPTATIPDTIKPDVYKNWLFKNTPELEDAIEAYFNKG